MLVIISDLHLTDGTSGQTISPGAFRIFRQRLSDLAYDASWRSDDRYRPIETMDIVLLGDILDVIRSTRWIFDDDGDLLTVRPWHDPTSQPFINKVQGINQAILARNDASMEVLRSLSQEQAITIPPADASGRPADVPREPNHPDRQPVIVRLHYMVGNHDWFYHLPGPAYNDLRQAVVTAMGLANPADEPFPHDLTESDTLSALFEAHQVFARHGDIYDAYNYDGDRDSSSLGDAVVVELINRFPTVIRQTLGTDLPRATLSGLNELDNVRPSLTIPIWINGLLRRTCRDDKLVTKVKSIWDDLADDFLNVPFVRRRDSALKFFDSVDKLEWALKFSQGLSFQDFSKVVNWVWEKFGGWETTHYQAALAEQSFRRKAARFIVHGHTHHQEVIPLDTSFVHGQRFDQVYLNSGTWRRIHQLARYNPMQQEFIAYHEMTYVAFFKGDERKGRGFEVWSGTLGE